MLVGAAQACIAGLVAPIAGAAQDLIVPGSVTRDESRSPRWPPSSARRRHLAQAREESADPIQGLLEALIRGRVAHADMARARRPEGTAGNDSNPLLGQKSFGKRLVGQAGRGRNLGERVERAT